jgi:dTDP-4-amino-4,6-dideoxygalactose transaminase
LKVSRREFFEKLKEEHIGLQVHYIPVHRQPYYRKNFGFQEGDFPAAESFYAREVSIPMYPSLKTEDLKYITQKIKSIAI